MVVGSAFQSQKISLPKMSFGLVQSGWGESECFNKNQISFGLTETHPWWKGVTPDEQGRRHVKEG